MKHTAVSAVSISVILTWRELELSFPQATAMHVPPCHTSKCSRAHTHTNTQKQAHNLRERKRQGEREGIGYSTIDMIENNGQRNWFPSPNGKHKTEHINVHNDLTLERKGRLAEKSFYLAGPKLLSTKESWSWNYRINFLEFKFSISCKTTMWKVNLALLYVIYLKNILYLLNTFNI